ncbi:MAG: DUF4230 domain-containing protein [Bacteroidota bacterium]
MRAIVYFLAGLLIIAIVGTLFFFVILPRMVTIPSLPDMKPEETIQVHSIVVEKVQGLKKMELEKYEFQDIVKHVHRIDWWPDPEVTLQAYGQVVACVDFAKIDSGHVVVIGDTIMLTLPEPEICYSRIDHDRSQVIETWYTSIYSDGKKMIDQAYKIAEDKMLSTAIEAGILDSAKIEARKALVPFLENLTQKEVYLSFPVAQKQPPKVESVDLPKEIKPESVR